LLVVLEISFVFDLSVIEGTETLVFSVGLLDDDNHFLSVCPPYSEGSLDSVDTFTVEVLPCVIGILDTIHNVVPIVFSEIFQIEQGFRVTNEDLCFTDLILIGTHEVISKNGLATGDIITLPNPLGSIRALLRNQIVSVHELLEDATESKTGTTDFQVVQQTEVDDLMQHSLTVIVISFLLIVGLDAADIVRSRFHQSLN